MNAGFRHLARRLLSAGVLAPLCLLACIPIGAKPASGAAASSAGVSVCDFGAVGDGETLNTSRIQAAIDQLSAKGRGTLVIPKGVFLSGAIFLKPGVNLHLDDGAVLKGSTNILDYPKMETRIEGGFTNWIPALVNADKCDHLRITGPGTLDGSGQVFYTEFWDARARDPKVANLAVERPRLAFIQNSRDVQVTDIHFKNSALWNLHLYRCADVLIENVSFESPFGEHPKGGPSTDGVDIDSSQRVTVRDCSFAVNDDCVCLKGTKGPFALEDTNSPPTEHIHVLGCAFNTGQGVVTLGSEACIIRDVVVENCTVTGKMPLVRIKVRPDTPQDYEKIDYRNITLAGTNAPFKDEIIDFEPWTRFFDLQGQPPPKSVVKDITMSDIKGSFGSLGEIWGKAGQTQISDITFRDIDVQLRNDKLSVTNVANLKIENVRVNGKPFALTSAN